MMVEQLLLPRGVLDAAQRLDRAADRGQRVLDLVRHIGGEASRSRPCAPTAPAPSRTARWPARRPRRAAAAASPARCRRARWPSRISAAAPARRRIGRAMVSDRYHDSSTVSASARPNRPRIDMRTTNRLSSTSRASRVSRMMPTVWRSRSHRLGHRHQQPVVLGAPDIGRHLAALARSRSAAAPPSRPAATPARRRPASVSSTSGARRSCGSSASTLSYIQPMVPSDRAVLDRRRQRLGARPRRPAPRAPGCRRSPCRPAHRAWPARSGVGSVRRRSSGRAIVRHQLRIVRRRPRAPRSRRARRHRCRACSRSAVTSASQQAVLVLVEIEQGRHQQRQRQRSSPAGCAAAAATPSARGTAGAAAPPEARARRGRGPSGIGRLSAPCSGSRCRTASRSG